MHSNQTMFLFIKPALLNKNMLWKLLNVSRIQTCFTCELIWKNGYNVIYFANNVAYFSCELYITI